MPLACSIASVAGAMSRRRRRSIPQSVAHIYFAATDVRPTAGTGPARHPVQSFENALESKEKPLATTLQGAFLLHERMVAARFAMPEESTCLSQQFDIFRGFAPSAASIFSKCPDAARPASRPPLIALKPPVLLPKSRLNPASVPPFPRSQLLLLKSATLNLACPYYTRDVSIHARARRATATICAIIAIVALQRALRR